ncbi:MAG: hypothetical protein ACRD3P_11840 [Terriglobales bacterium]
MSASVIECAQYLISATSPASADLRDPLRKTKNPKLTETELIPFLHGEHSLQAL